MKEAVSTSKAPAALGQCSQAIICGHLVYVSGQIPLDPETNQMPEAVTEQTRQCLYNLKAILEAAGSSLDKVVRVGIFLTDLADFKAMDEVYATFFTGSPPAKALVQVVALPQRAKIEIEAIAEI